MNKSDREPIKLFDGFDFDIYNSYLKPHTKKIIIITDRKKIIKIKEKMLKLYILQYLFKK